jgi:hypothetical protein
MTSATASQRHIRECVTRGRSRSDSFRPLVSPPGATGEFRGRMRQGLEEVVEIDVGKSRPRQLYGERGGADACAESRELRAGLEDDPVFRLRPSAFLEDFASATALGGVFRLA